MDTISHILSDRKFWASYYSTQWAGCVVSREWPHGHDFGHHLFAITREECLSLWKKVTRWYDGVFEEADGYVDNPGTIDISVGNDLALRVEIHPGGKIYRLGRNAPQQIVGNMRPHWRLPALRWWEAKAISITCGLGPSISHDKASSFTLLLLAPVVWLTENETLAEAASAIEQAWIISELVDEDTASRFGQESANAMSVGPKYRWWNDPNLGWVTDSKWSLRYSERDPSSIKPINELLASACDAKNR